MQGSAFCGLQDEKFYILTYFSEKYEKLQWCLWGKLDNDLNHHNSAVYKIEL